VLSNGVLIMMPASTTIKNIRIHLCLNQTEFAKQIGVAKETVSRYETGERKPRLTIIRKIKELAEKNDIPVRVEDFFD
jgi:DNA-binding XRE family transcriptional regulator